MKLPIICLECPRVIPELVHSSRPTPNRYRLCRERRFANFRPFPRAQARLKSDSVYPNDAIGGRYGLLSRARLPFRPPWRWRFSFGRASFGGRSLCFFRPSSPTSAQEGDGSEKGAVQISPHRVFIFSIRIRGAKGLSAQRCHLSGTTCAGQARLTGDTRRRDGDFWGRSRIR